MFWGFIVIFTALGGSKKQDYVKKQAFFTTKLAFYGFFL